MILAKVTGVKQIAFNMKKVNSKLSNNFSRGLKRGGLFLLKHSKKIVPVQVGTLRSSGFCRNVGGSGFRTDIVVGYTAEYAAYVHEDLEKAHGKAFNIKHASEIATAKGMKRGTAAGGMFKRGEDQQAKFLEKPAREKRPEILAIIRGEASAI